MRPVVVDVAVDSTHTKGPRFWRYLAGAGLTASTKLRRQYTQTLAAGAVRRQIWLSYMHANVENTSTSSRLTNLPMESLSSHINVPNWEAVKMQPICGKYDPIDVNGYMQITYFATYELPHTGGKFFYLLHLCLNAFPNE